MSQKQAKIQRREIRRAAETGLRTMQEQQENAIEACIQQTNKLTYNLQILTAKLHNVSKELDELRAAVFPLERRDPLVMPVAAQTPTLVEG